VCSQLRGALIGALDKCSENLHNMDQISKTSDTMTSVTSVPDEVKDTDKVCGAYSCSFDYFDNRLIEAN